MIEMKQLLPMTGYMRGGCSPIGIKKTSKLLHHSALKKEKILVSAGIRGLQIEIAVKDLISYVKMEVKDIVV